MSTIFNRIMGCVKGARNQRGVVSVEWIILAIVVMVAIVAAFAPALRTALTNGVTAVSNALTTQSGAAAGGGGS